MATDLRTYITSTSGAGMYTSRSLSETGIETLNNLHLFVSLTGNALTDLETSLTDSINGENDLLYFRNQSDASVDIGYAANTSDANFSNYALVRLAKGNTAVFRRRERDASYLLMAKAITSDALLEIIMAGGEYLMATNEIKASVQKVTGEKPASYTIENAQRFVVSSVPKNLMWQFAHETRGDGNNVTLPQKGDIILAAQLGDYPAMEVPLRMRRLVEDINSLHKATESCPVYYILGNNQVALRPKDSGGGSVTYVNYRFVDDNSDLRNAVIFRANAEMFEYLSAKGISTWIEILVPPAIIEPFSVHDLKIKSKAPKKPSTKITEVIIAGDPPQYKIPALEPKLTKTVVFSKFVSDLSKIDPGSLEIKTKPIKGPTLDDVEIVFDAAVPVYDSPKLVPRIPFKKFVSGLKEKDPGDLKIVVESPKEPTLADSKIIFKTKAPIYDGPKSIKSVSFDKFVSGLKEKDPGDLKIKIKPIKGPTLNDAKIDFDAKAPIYKSPKLDSRVSFKKFIGDLRKLDPGDIVIKAKAPKAPKIPNYKAGFRSFPSMPTIVGGLDSGWKAAFDEDDLEKAASALGRNAALIQEQQAAFGTEIKEAQGKIEALLNKAKYEEDAETQAKLNLYRGEITEYQQTTVKEVQIYTQKLEKYKTIVSFGVTTWQKEETDKLQEYQSNMQNALNAFNEDNAEYQARLKVVIQESQLQNSDDSQELQNYATAIQSYQAEVGKEINQYQQNLSKYNTELTNSLNSWKKEEDNKNQKFQSDMQNALNDFNEKNANFQAQLQISIQEAQLQSTDDAQKLQKYNALVQNYQIDVTRAVTQYQQNFTRYNTELNTSLKAWQKEESDKLDEYKTDIQNVLNSFNEKNTEYQAQLQVSMQRAQLITAANIQKVQQFTASIENYKSKIGTEVTQYQQNFGRYTLELNTSLQAWQKEETDKIARYQADIQKFSTDMQNALNKFNEENVEYQVSVQKSLQEANFREKGNEYELAKYTAALNEYQLSINKEVQEYSTTIDKKAQEYQNRLALYNADIQKYNAQVAEEAQKSASSLQSSTYYSNESKKYHELATQEITLYIQNNSKMIGATMAARSSKR